MMHAKQLLLLSSFAQGAVINSSQGGGGGVGRVEKKCTVPKSQVSKEWTVLSSR